MNLGHPSHPHDLISAMVDGEIAASDRARVEEHLSECAECRALLDDLRFLAEASGAETPPPVPSDLAARIRWRVEAEAGRGARKAPRQGWLSPMPLGAAAGLMVAFTVLWILRDSLSPERGSGAPTPAATMETEPLRIDSQPEPPPEPPRASAQPQPPAEAAPPGAAGAEPLRPSPREDASRGDAEGVREFQEAKSAPPDEAVRQAPVLDRTDYDALVLAPGVTDTDADGAAAAPPASTTGEPARPARGVESAIEQRKAEESSIEQRQAEESAIERRKTAEYLTERASRATGPEVTGVRPTPLRHAGDRALRLELPSYRVTVWENGLARLEAPGYECVVQVGATVRPGMESSPAPARASLGALFDRAFSTEIAALPDREPRSSRYAPDPVGSGRGITLEAPGGPPRTIRYTKPSSGAPPPAFAGLEEEILALVGGPSLGLFEERCSPLPASVEGNE